MCCLAGYVFNFASFHLNYALFYNNKWLFFIPVPAHHLQVMAVVSNIIGPFLSPVLQLLCVCMFVTITQLEAKGSMGDVGGHVLKLSLSLRKIKQSIGRKVRFNFFFLSFALLEKTNLPGFVQDSCLFPQRKEERKHEWLQLSFLFLKTTKTVILNFKKGVCYFHM